MIHRIRKRMYEIVIEPPINDRIGNCFSLFILLLIACNVLVCILETEASFYELSPQFFSLFDFISVIIFSAEYILRLWSCTASPSYKHPIFGRIRFALLPMSLVDLLAILPFYLHLLIPGIDLRFIRILRLFRIFRIFRSGHLASSFRMIKNVVTTKKDELIMSSMIMFFLVIISANIIYLVEHQEQNTLFTSVPQSMWWSIITITTIGYGDMYPITALGKIVGSITAFLGVCAFALPVAVIGAGFLEQVQEKKTKEDNPERLPTFQQVYPSLCISTVINTNIREAWNAWTSKEGIESFFAPSCQIEAKVDGAYEIFFAPEATPGSRGSEGMKISALQTEKLLSFSWNAPPHLEEIRQQKTFVCIRFKKISAEKTQILLSHDGWGEGEEWQEAFDYFSYAWGSIVLPRLKYRFENGPIDWENLPKI